MRLRELELAEFRSFRSLHLSIAPAGFRLIGPNASGKSSLLEAIAMLATMRSPRTSAEREIANWQSGADLAVPPYARLRAEFDRLDGAHQIEIGLSVEDREGGPLKKRPRFDDRPVRAIDAVGHLKTVLFSPEDVDLLAGSPSLRRRYIDMATSQASRTYLRALSRFGRVLEQRNSLLRRFARDGVRSDAARPAEELTFWNSELTMSAAEVLAMRLGVIAYVSSRARVHYHALTGDDTLGMTYATPRLNMEAELLPGDDWQAPSQSMRQGIAAAFAASLQTTAVEEFRRGVTVVGPHRDDFAVTASGIDIGRFGSRGQQRLAVIAVKLGELDLLETAAAEPPILLLDDVLSELDARHREKIVAVLASRNAQICVTATDVTDLAATELAHVPLIEIDGGVIELSTA